MTCKAVPQPHESHTVVMDDGTPISLRRHGNLDSPTRLLLTHGCGLATDAYWPFWSQLTDSYEVVLFDMRSHGHSGLGPLESLTIATLVSDSVTVLDAVQAKFGSKPVAGLFHSMGCVVGLLHAAQRDDSAALVLYDLPMRPTRGRPEDLEAISEAMASAASMRRDTFADPDELAKEFNRNPAFQLVPPQSIDLVAASTLRETPGGWALSCPPVHEAKLSAQMSESASKLPSIINRLELPVRVIGADPTISFNHVPTIDMSGLITDGYDYVPNCSHFLQLEDPGRTAQLAVEFLTKSGLSPAA